MRLQGKRALVTGARRGIGRAIAMAFAAEGADVAVNDVTGMDQAEEVCAAIAGLGRRAISIQADVSLREDVERMVETAWTGLGPLDILVTNAGIETIVPLVELTDEQWERVTQINLKGSWLCAQIFARRLIAEGRGGAMVTLGSIQAGLALPGRTHYAPTKRGVEALTRNLAAELAEHGIRVNCIHPGVIETDMTQWVIGDPQILAAVCEKIPMHRHGQPEEVATAAVFFASDEARYITGQHLYVDGGMIVV
jgi:NAD(P)-dependent dehydrogenase (short-subunit alcohol dehydrogenase family)